MANQTRYSHLVIEAKGPVDPQVRIDFAQDQMTLSGLDGSTPVLVSGVDDPVDQGDAVNLLTLEYVTRQRYVTAGFQSPTGTFMQAINFSAANQFLPIGNGINGVYNANEFSLLAPTSDEVRYTGSSTLTFLVSTSIVYRTIGPRARLYSWRIEKNLVPVPGGQIITKGDNNNASYPREQTIQTTTTLQTNDTIRMTVANIQDTQGVEIYGMNITIIRT